MKENKNTISMEERGSSRRVIRKNTTIRTSTKKSILIRCHLLQFAGALLIAIALVIIAVIYFNKNNNTVVKEVEVERIVEVEKPVEIVKEIEVVNEDEVSRLANQMFTELKEVYVAEVNSEATEKAIIEIRNNYIAQADNAEVARLAELQAQQMFEEFKTNYAAQIRAEVEAEAEAARVATKSTISVYVYYKSTSIHEFFYLEINGSLHDRLTPEMIRAELEAGGYLDGFTIERFENRDAVEVFIEENYTSTRRVKLQQI